MEPTNISSSMQSSLPLLQYHSYMQVMQPLTSECHNNCLGNNCQNTMLWQHKQLPLPQQEHTTTTTTNSSLPCDKLGTQKSLRKKRRAPRRAATTVLTTDATNFRAMVQEFTGIPSSPLLTQKVTTSNYYPFRPLAQNPLFIAQSFSLLNGHLSFQSGVQQPSSSNHNTNATTYNPGTLLQELSGIFGNEDQLFTCSNDVNMCSTAFAVPHMTGAWCDGSLALSNDDLNGVCGAVVASNIVSDRNKNDSNQEMEKVISADNFNF